MPKMKMKNTSLTITVPEAGERYFGLCRNASYAAAARGEIPTIRIGKLLRVPVRAMEAMLDRAAARAPNGAPVAVSDGRVLENITEGAFC